MTYDASKKKDIGWNYGMQGPTKKSFICMFCKVTYNGGVTRHKQLLMGGNRNVKQWLSDRSYRRNKGIGGN